MARHMLYVHFRLIRSAAGQKAEAKPVSVIRDGERRQGRAAMLGREVACLPGGVGLPLGQSLERASPFLAKFGLSAFFWTGRAVAHAVNDALKPLVLHAIMPCKWMVHLTDEVPQCLGSKVRVRAGYKSDTKGWLNALVTETASPRLRLWGCQQRQSRHGFPALPKDKTSECPGPGTGSWNQLAQGFKATKWPGGTSSRQIAGLLRNSSQQPVSVVRTVRPH